MGVFICSTRTSAYYVLGIPFGVYLAFWRHQGLTGLWIGLTVSLVYSATAGCAVCLCADWDEEVDKVQRRLGGSDECGGGGGGARRKDSDETRGD